MFRAWFHACQLGLIGFLLVLVGMVFPGIREAMTVGLLMVVPLGLIGAVLGVVGVTHGIRSACSLCGAEARWLSPSKNMMALDCPHCGLVGGNPWRDLKPRVLSEFGQEEDENLAPPSV